MLEAGSGPLHPLYPLFQRLSTREGSFQGLKAAESAKWPMDDFQVYHRNKEYSN